jgi:hypothetical protein
MIILNVFFKVKEDSKRNFLGLLENMVVESSSGLTLKIQIIIH